MQEHILDFGQFAGKPLEQVPIYYLKYIVNFDNLTPQLRQVIQALITPTTEKDEEIAFLQRQLAIAHQEADVLRSILDPKNCPPERQVGRPKPFLHTLTQTPHV